jgi:hypothetical protein
VPAAATRLATTDAALIRPPVINSTGLNARPYYLYGCVATPATGIVGSIVLEAASLLGSLSPVTSLQQCANACASGVGVLLGGLLGAPFRLFGMTVNK